METGAELLDRFLGEPGGYRRRVSPGALPAIAHPDPDPCQVHPEGPSMSITHRDMPCSPAEVFAVLADGWLLGLWVVGAARIRDVDGNWPAPGSTAHHSVGSWPLLVDDDTTVEAVVPDRSLRLLARAWPAGEADVLIEITARPGGCRVTMTEDAVKGPGVLMPKPLRSIALHWRNTESLRRLAYVAQRRRKTVTD